MLCHFLLHAIIFLSTVSSHLLGTVLRTYHNLHVDDVTIRQFTSNSIVLSLKLGDVFYVSTLTPHREIFHKHFKTLVLDVNSTTRLGNPMDGHYIGQLDNYTDSRVVVHIGDNSLITGNIELEGEVYYIEPSWRHISEPHDFHMIVYKKSDVINKLGHPETGRFCGNEHGENPFVVPLDSTSGNNVSENNSFKYESRSKRAPRPENTCEVILIADYKFFTDIGGGSEFQTKTFLIAIFERINHIFKSTVFETSDQSFSGYGMQIRTMLIHKSPTVDPNNYNHQRSGGWDVSDMLDAFGYGTESLGETWSNYCLAHLYTNYDFDAGVLGLAYVASPVSNKVGGICSAPYYSYRTRKLRMLNVGLSTSRNYGRTLLSSELEVVSAHEMGHNWGSSHDPDNTVTCAPPGDRFIMYPSAVDGSTANNKRFSPCSKTAIASVLKYKANCFVEPALSFCGNGIVEESEDCDAGPEKTSDLCCTDECNFRSHAVCSDHNSDCCVDCKFAGTQHVCYQTEDNLLDVFNGCVAEKRCSAKEAKCSIIQHKAAGEPCFDEGTCSKDGICLDFCQSKGYALCQGKGNSSCYWMCSGSDGVCSQTYSVLPDGKPCLNGVCVGGTCVVEPQTQVKIWQILTGLTPSVFWTWMKNNVVLVVIVITSVFWMPLAVFVNWLDKGQDEIEYYTMTMERNRHAVRTQMSTVSSKSFEMRPIIASDLEEGHVFTVTGERF